MYKQMLISGAIAAASVLSGAAQAQALHEGDIELAVQSGKVLTLGAAAVHGVDGGAIYESDFGDLAGGPYRTDDPGFDSDNGTFASGTLVQYRALGALQFWNGSTWSASVPSTEYVQIEGNLGEITKWTTSGVLGDVTGLIGEAGSVGKVHEHLDLRVLRDVAGAPTVGAYLVQLQVQANGYTDSDPFYVVFNRGLSATAFEGAVQTLTTPVPEPGSWALMAAGLAIVVSTAKRRKG